VFDGVDLGGADATGAVLDADTRKAFERAGNASVKLREMEVSLDEAVAEHARWITSHGASGKRLDLSGFDLTNCNFDGKDLSGAVLRNVVANRATFRGALMVLTDFAAANMAGADLSDADLRAVTFKRAFLADAKLVDANLQPVRLGGAEGQVMSANFERARLWRADLSRALLRKAQLGYADFSDAILKGADLREAILEKTSFERADTTGMLSDEIPSGR
jgi:uncharacterized protein YjbI with pentapeptide repeats